MLGGQNVTSPGPWQEVSLNLGSRGVSLAPSSASRDLWGRLHLETLLGARGMLVSFLFLPQVGCIVGGSTV